SPWHYEMLRVHQVLSNVIAPRGWRNGVVRSREDQYRLAGNHRLIEIFGYGSLRPELTGLHPRVEKGCSQESALSLARDLAGLNARHVLGTHHRKKHTLTHRAFRYVA